jgi:hypothetical protein
VAPRSGIPEATGGDLAVENSRKGILVGEHTFAALRAGQPRRNGRDRADVERDLRERAVAWVERSCAEQGVPVKLSDPVALAKIADILSEGRDKRSSS